MKAVQFAFAIGLGLSGFISPLFAHHSIQGSHDSSKAVSIIGTIARVEWTNPHVSIILSVTRPNGDVVTERVQIAAPGRLTKTGLSANFLKFGDRVTLETWLPKNDPRFAGVAPSGRVLILPDGRFFDVGDLFGQIDRVQ
jgi:hypothetical protein